MGRCAGMVVAGMVVAGAAGRRGLHAVRRLVRVTGVAIVLLALAACGSSSSGGGKAAQASAPPSPAAPPSTPGGGKKFYVSIGDSYAAGYMPTSSGAIGSTTTSGFAYQLGSTATVHGQRLTLVNFGCAGATTTSLLHGDGCLPERLGPGAAGYPRRTQAQAALSFISAHRADVGLVTVVIGGNDITSCAKSKGTPATVSCLTTALLSVTSHLHGFLSELRAASGPGVLIVGVTYPDVILGQYVSGTATGHSLASLSVTAFKGLINPALAAQYHSVGATFVDVTAASGAYLPFSQTTTLAPYGKVPAAVAKACQLTYYCQFHDIHPRAVGYSLIADQIRQALPG